MKLVVCMLLFSLSMWVVATPINLSYGGCSITLPADFEKNKNAEYYYFLGKQQGFKSISIIESENPHGYLDDITEIKDLNVFKADDFFVFSYKLLVGGDAKDNPLLVNYVLFWGNENSMIFMGFQEGDVKSLIYGCSKDWYPISKEQFFYEIGEINRRMRIGE